VDMSSAAAFGAQAAADSETSDLNPKVALEMGVALTLGGKRFPNKDKPGLRLRSVARR